MFIYEMHQHTAPCSACAGGDPADTVLALKYAGFSGMVLTNHFLHGNTGIDRDLPWEDFVRCYENDYLTAKEAGDKNDFDVLFGIEEHVGRGKEILLYGITPEFLYRHPELRDGGLEAYSNAARQEGVLVFQAHPYRDRSYIADPLENLPIELLDGFETYNAENKDEANVLAAEYAERHGLLVSAGSDAHFEYRERRFGIQCPHRIRTEEELARTLKSREYSLYLG